MMAAHPGWPALVNTFHIATTITTVIAISQIQNNGPGACPWPEAEYSTCANKRAGVNKTVCATSMSEFIKVKSYARFKRLLPERQGKSFARSHIARHLAMLATWQTSVSLCTHPHPQPANAGDTLPKNRTLLVQFLLPVFRFGLFLER